MSSEAAFETFAQVGNLETLAQIRAALDSKQTTCALNAKVPVLTQKRMDELTARIQTRLNAK